MIKATQKNI